MHANSHVVVLRVFVSHSLTFDCKLRLQTGEGAPVGLLLPGATLRRQPGGAHQALLSTGRDLMVATVMSEHSSESLESDVSCTLCNKRTLVL